MRSSLGNQIGAHFFIIYELGSFSVPGFCQKDTSMRYDEIRAGICFFPKWRGKNTRVALGKFKIDLQSISGNIRVLEN